MTALDAPVNPTPDFATAAQAFAAFVADRPRVERLVALHDSDADGITAGVIWQRAMERLGFANPTRVAPDRERSAWTDANRARMETEKPDALFVLDLGVQPVVPLPGVPTCFIDHHRPEGMPPDAATISAYSWEPIPTTSLLMWELAATRTDVADLDWIAAIGVFSDLGERAPFPLVEDAKRKYTAKYLKEATALLNAARRASRYDPEAAARALLKYSDPRELATAADDPDVEQMRRSREEVKAALDEAKKAAPVFAGQVALIRMNSPCQIHPLVAQIWRTRLPKYLVIAANEGYMPGRVNFSARSAPGVSVLAYLRGLDLPPGEGAFGLGHDQASGGSLPPDRWNALLERMGFPPTVGVKL